MRSCVYVCKYRSTERRSIAAEEAANARESIFNKNRVHCTRTHARSHADATRKVFDTVRVSAAMVRDDVVKLKSNKSSAEWNWTGGKCGCGVCSVHISYSQCNYAFNTRPTFRDTLPHAGTTRDCRTLSSRTKVYSVSSTLLCDVMRRAHANGKQSRGAQPNTTCSERQQQQRTCVSSARARHRRCTLAKQKHTKRTHVNGLQLSAPLA